MKKTAIEVKLINPFEMDPENLDSMDLLILICDMAKQLDLDVIKKRVTLNGEEMRTILGVKPKD